MTRVCDIEKMLYDWAPRDLALEWDNVGLLVGDSGAEVRKVLVSLDVTEADIQAARDAAGRTA